MPIKKVHWFFPWMVARLFLKQVHPEIMRLNGVGQSGNYYELGDDDKELLVQMGCDAYRIEVVACGDGLWYLCVVLVE